MITAQDVAKLRQITGAGMMDAKKALEESSGDFEKAKELLQSRYAEKADKKADRETSEGFIGTYVHNGKSAALVALACETDFVARNDEFRELAQNIALHITAMIGEDATIQDILDSNYIKNPSLTIAELLKSKIGVLGENIQIKSFRKISL
jgi:elongation factor Ts